MATCTHTVVPPKKPETTYTLVLNEQEMRYLAALTAATTPAIDKHLGLPKGTEEERRSSSGQLFDVMLNALDAANGLDFVGLPNVKITKVGS